MAEQYRVRAREFEDGGDVLLLALDAELATVAAGSVATAVDGVRGHVGREDVGQELPVLGSAPGSGGHDQGTSLSGDSDGVGGAVGGGDPCLLGLDVGHVLFPYGDVCPVVRLLHEVTGIGWYGVPLPPVGRGLTGTTATEVSRGP
jgi:hypothetical protein